MATNHVCIDAPYCGCVDCQTPAGVDAPADTFAAFVVAKVGGGLIAATTRAADRGEAGKIGLPGGKLDEGETARAAALREAAEEGWAVSGLADAPFHVATVEGRTVVWFAARHARPFASFKEAGRITPVSVPADAVALSGYGNDAAMTAWAAL